MGKNEVKCNAKLRSHYFSVNVSVLTIVYRRKISKNRQFQAKLLFFFKFVGEIQELVRKRSQKSNKDVILHNISLPIYPSLFPKFCPIQKQ